MFVHKNHAAGGENGSIMVRMVVFLCLASQKPSEREFFVPARTDLGVKLLSISDGPIWDAPPPKSVPFISAELADNVAHGLPRLLELEADLGGDLLQSPPRPGSGRSPLWDR